MTVRCTTLAAAAVEMAAAGTVAEPTAPPAPTAWIARLAADERKRDDVRLQASEAAARKASSMRASVHADRRPAGPRGPLRARVRNN
jgi:hypothetical protein